MATFEVKVYPLRIEEHPNADTLELAVVGDYRSIVRKGQFKTGDLGVYIPESAIVPENVLFQLGLIDKLAGKDKNRVKAVKLRGILSQGIVLPVSQDGDRGTVYISYTDPETGVDDYLTVNEGDEVSEFLHIVKYEPPIPTHMSGEVFNAYGATLKFDIENYKKFPHIISEGEPVVMTEKLHGTWTCIGWNPEVEGNYVITSKGLSGNGLAFKMNEANKDNLYIRSFESTKGADGLSIVDLIRRWFDNETPIYVLGETFGKGVQDLTYGLTKPSFRVFDIYVGIPGQGHYMAWEKVKWLCDGFKVETVPVVYMGPFSREKLLEVTGGKDLISGTNMREGVVVKPLFERNDDEIGRVVLKSVSEEYLLRHKGTEFN